MAKKWPKYGAVSEECPESGGSSRFHVELQQGAAQRAMKKSGVRRGVLVYKGPDPAGKMEIPDQAGHEGARVGLGPDHKVSTYS